MANSRTKNTILNAIGGVAVRIVTLLTMFITRTVFIKVLGMQYAGVSGVFTDVLTMLSFAELGIGQAITYALYKPIATGDERQIAKLMNVYKRIYTVIAIIVLSIGTALIPFLRYIIKEVPDVVEDIRLIYVFYLLSTASSYLLIYKSTFLTAAQKDYIVSRVKVLFTVIKAAVECVLLIVFRNFLIYLGFSVVANLLQNYILAKITEKHYPVIKERNAEKLEPSERKKLINDVRALALYKVSGTVLNGTDSVITSSILGTVYVGILGNYNLISNNVYLFVMQIFNATSA
ncbi:MAG: teichoic acid transporter, partial [Lachnospiraceae bacterium]|nr:teichoic acid transporter [Lachnospiraceae bacterium]